MSDLKKTKKLLVSHGPLQEIWVKLQQCVQYFYVSMVWLPEFGIFNVCTDVACDCIWRQYGHCKSLH